MKTWQHFANNEGSATTTWNYNAYRGWLDNKVHADGKGPVYTYSSAGRLKSRAWARGVTTWYTNNAAGDLWVVNYADSTADVTNTYDRRGRQRTVIHNGTTTTLSYGDANQLLSESPSGGTLDTWNINFTYDTRLRRNVLEVKQGTTLKIGYSYQYDNASRLQKVWQGSYSANYVYEPNSSLIDRVEYKYQSTTTRLTVDRAHDSLNRLQAMNNLPQIGQPVNYSYQYNPANQRTALTNADNARWVYSYDALGQVTSGKKYWSDGTPVAGQHFEYAFDDIGNRQSTKAGGDNSGANLRPASYLNNSLNQILSREVPSYVNVLGTKRCQSRMAVS